MCFKKNYHNFRYHSSPILIHTCFPLCDDFGCKGNFNDQGLKKSSICKGIGFNPMV